MTESQNHRGLNSLGKRVGVPQVYSKTGTDASETWVCSTGIKVSTYTSTGLESLSMSSGLSKGTSISTRYLVFYHDSLGTGSEPYASFHALLPSR